MKHLRLLGPALVEALGRCKGHLYGYISAPSIATKETMLKAALAIAVVVLNLNVIEHDHDELELSLRRTQRPAAGLVLSAFSLGYAHHWLPGMTPERAKAYAAASEKGLGKAIGLLNLALKDVHTWGAERARAPISPTGHTRASLLPLTRTPLSHRSCVPTADPAHQRRARQAGCGAAAGAGRTAAGAGRTAAGT
jgi:hypothetical protein